MREIKVEDVYTYEDDTHLYSVFYTDEFAGRSNDIVVGLANALNFALAYARCDSISFVTIHNTERCNLGIFKGVINTTKLLYTLDTNDEQSVALAIEEDVPCIIIV